MTEQPTPKDFAPGGFIHKNLWAHEVEEAIALQTRMRELIGLSNKDACVGCFLGDAGPTMHDYGYSCEYGEGAF